MQFPKKDTSFLLYWCNVTEFVLHFILNTHSFTAKRDEKTIKCALVNISLSYAALGSKNVNEPVKTIKCFIFCDSNKNTNIWWLIQCLQLHLFFKSVYCSPYKKLLYYEAYFSSMLLLYILLRNILYAFLKEKLLQFYYYIILLHVTYTDKSILFWSRYLTFFIHSLHIVL